MTYCLHPVDVVFDIKTKRVDQIRRWAKTLFCGEELSLLGTLIGALAVDRRISANGVANAIPDKIDELPLRGCEQRIFETLIEALHERGQSDADIREIVETFGSVIEATTNERIGMYTHRQA
ncbi:MAG: hypothetical protein MJE77_29390 [Proteobacteria bacterium]|nr:hypothetical protein [Pseudomonadota bacterium]